MNNTLIKQTFPIIVVISILSGVYWLNNSKPINLGANQCYLTDENCQIEIDQMIVSLRLATFPVQVEEMSTLFIELPNRLELQQSWIEGTNMYMGRTPVIEEHISTGSNNTEHNMVFFLGACSEPQMRWRLVLNLKDIVNEQVHTANIYFQTEYR